MAQSPYTDLARPPLDAVALRRALVVPGGLWTDLVLHDATASTNADAATAARDGAPEGLVVVAERQSAGRGRLDRRWESPARAGLTVSVLLRPEKVPANRYGWLPLLAGVALAGTVRGVAELDAVLKWPNDVLVGGRKCGGILAEAVHDAVVLGVGLNVTLRPDELPGPQATSLALAGAGSTDRDPLLRALLRALARWYERWRDTDGDPDTSGLRAAYLDDCATLGQRVRVAFPDGTDLVGEARTIDDDGRLVVEPDGGPAQAVAAGDVVYVRR